MSAPVVVRANGTGKQQATAEKEKDKKKRRKKKHHRAIPEVVMEHSSNGVAGNGKEDAGSDVPSVEVEYVAPQAQASDPAFAAFADVFKFFAPPEELCNPVKQSRETEEAADEDGEKAGKEDDSSSADGEEGGAAGQDDEAALYDENGQRKPTKKERKELKRRKIAILKQHVARPELVDLHDANSADPILLVYLKGYRNSVPVPRHWSQKRRYLQCKRGQEKAAFQLPEFIAQTGISKLRAAYEEKQAAKNAKTKQRERMAPKMHRMDIDYQVLHDAFFKFQTKPKLTSIGDVYYEGKELEVRPKNKRPGELSDELKRALGMPPGAPPPWLLNMQRYGPAPSYPALKVAGLNAPIPSSAHWGYHPGGWGKPPVDEQGRPLYGDVFGLAAADTQQTAPVNRVKWGEVMEEEDDDESSEANEEADGTAGEKKEEGVEGKEGETHEEEDLSGTVTSESGVTSLQPGLETPDAIDLRKGKAGAESRPLYQVLPQTDASVGGAVYGSAHRYVVPAAAKPAAGGGARVDIIKSQRTEKLSVAIDPSEMETGEGLSEALLKDKYAKALQGEAQDDEERKRKRKKDKEQETRKFKF